MTPSIRHHDLCIIRASSQRVFSRPSRAVALIPPTHPGQTATRVLLWRLDDTRGFFRVTPNIPLGGREN
eukprot:scaffold8798_cov101-Phaeocystis_antarctica.AAC.2